MLKARFSNGVFVLGLCAMNIKRLQDGKPILVSLAEIGGTDDVLIMAGDTNESMMAELEKSTGRKLPAAVDLKKSRH